MGRKFEGNNLNAAGRRIVARCESMEINLAELSRRCGWDPEEDTRLYRLIRADVMPLDDAIVIARETGLTVEDLTVKETE